MFLFKKNYKKIKNDTYKYLYGFMLSIILTVTSFLFVSCNLMENWSINSKFFFLLGLACVQVFIQIVFFLHLNEGPDAKWNIISILISIFCIFIIILGTWLTMQHLNQNMMDTMNL